MNPQETQTPPYDPPQKPNPHSKTPSFCSDITIFIFGALLSLLLTCSLWSFTTPQFSNFPSNPRTRTQLDTTTFYDDPDFTYTLDTLVQNWDEKRNQWQAQNPRFAGPDKVVMVTGSQPNPCESLIGDHFLLRLFKNKTDYYRLQGYDIFYNNVLLDQRMFTFWAKYPVVKFAMLARPEAEWIWCVNSDAAIIDMGFTLPLERYKAHNLVIHGWPNLVFEKKGWSGLNADVFLIRNCQWSMELLDKWAKFGLLSLEYKKWGQILKSVFTDKLYLESDDQTGLAYLVVKEGQKWNEKIYLEKEYYFEGYWGDLVDKLENITACYNEVERVEYRLRQRCVKKARAQLKERDVEDEKMKRPFITHFTGCEPCSGNNNNKMYSLESCYKAMNLALNFANNQVLSSFGYFRPDLHNTNRVQPLRS